MKWLMTLVAIAGITICGFANGEEPGPNYEQLKPLEWLIGNWVIESRISEDVPGLAKKGDPIKMSIEVKWGLNKNVMQTQAEIFIKDMLVGNEAGIIGWDAEMKHIVEYGFDTRGGRKRIVTTVVDNTTLTSTGRSVQPDGTIRKSNAEVKWIDENTMTFTEKNITIGGVKQPDTPPVTAKRK